MMGRRYNLDLDMKSSLRRIPSAELDKLIVQGIRIRLEQDSDESLRRDLVGLLFESRDRHGVHLRTLQDYVPVTHDGETPDGQVG
jgi:hypothetical protein